MGGLGTEKYRQEHDHQVKTTGKRVVEWARSFLGCHYLNGAYGAYPRKTATESGDGLTKLREGGVVLITDPARLDPAIHGTDDPTKKKALAVKAATYTVTREKTDATTGVTVTTSDYCVCAGRYLGVGGGWRAELADQDLQDYLATLRKTDPKEWKNMNGNLTPRRVYGQGEPGHIVWGENCTDIRHFDCITYVNYCMTKAHGRELTLAIDQWSDERKGQSNWKGLSGATVYRLLDNASIQPKNGDLVIGRIGVNLQHIGILDQDGTVYQAANTNYGVHANSRFSPSEWKFLARMPG